MVIDVSNLIMLFLGVIAASVLGQTVIYTYSKKTNASLLMIFLGVFSFAYLLSSLQLHVFTLDGDYQLVFKWQVTLYFIQAICILLVFYQYGQKYHKVLFMLNLFWLGVMLVANIIMPMGIVYESFYDPEVLFELGGEAYYLTLGEIQPAYGFFALITYALQYMFLGAMIYSFYKTKNNYKAYLFSLFFLIFLMANVVDVLIDLGEIRFIYLSEYVGILVLFLLTIDLLVYTINNQRFEREVGLLRHNIQSIIEKSGVYFLGLDSEGKISYVNTYLVEKVGEQPHAFIGMSVAQIIDEDQDLKKFEHWVKAVDITETFDFSLLTKAKELLHISWTKVKLQNVDRSVIDAFLIGVDVTENMLAQAELRRMNEEMEEIRQQLENENTYLKEVVVDSQSSVVNYVDDWLLGKDLKYQLADATNTTSHVMLIGETGVGKEAIAESIAKNGNTEQSPFLKIKCGAFSAFQIEAELFGYVKGAFMTATKDMPGKLGLVNGGTLFLDRIHDLPVEIQKKVLYVLENGEYKPLGSQQTFNTTFKLISSSNYSLKKLRDEKLLCDDFYYQVTKLPIPIKPLRLRMDDFEKILTSLLTHYAKEYLKEVPKISVAVMNKMKGYHWPGNIKELSNVIEHYYISGSNRRFRFDLNTLEARKSTMRPSTLAEIEESYIRKALDVCNWKISGANSASEYLGLNESTLRSKMKKWNISQKKS